MIEHGWRAGIILDQREQILFSAVASEFYYQRLKAAMGRTYFCT